MSGGSVDPGPTGAQPLFRCSGSALLHVLLYCLGCVSGPNVEARLYVTSGFTDEVLRLDPDDGSLLGRIPVDPRPGELDEPHAVAVSPRRDFWYATVAHGEPTLWKFELPSDRLVGRVRLGMGGAGRIGIAVEAGLAFVPDYFRSGGGEPSSVAVLRLADLEITRYLTLCPAPHDAQVEPRGARVAITCSLSDEVILLDSRTARVLARFPVDPQPGAPGSPRFRPLNLAWARGGDTLFVTLHTAGLVRGFDTRGEVVGSTSVGMGPAQIAVSADGTRMVVANRGSSSLSIVAIPEFTELAQVDLGVPHPHGVAVAGSELWTTQVGANTLGIAYVDSVPRSVSRGM